MKAAPSGAARHRPVEHSCDETPAETRTCYVAELIVAAFEDDVRCTNSAADCGADALGHVTRGEARGIASDEGVTDAHYIHTPAKEVAVAVWVVLRARCELAIEQAG